MPQLDRQIERVSDAGIRLGALAAALFATFMLFGFGRGVWTYYWVNKDTRESTAVILQMSPWGHGAFDYRYIVGQRAYFGRGRTDPHDPRYRRGDEFYRLVQPGDTAPVHYSASHPWLSTLCPVSYLFPPLPMVVIGLFLETLALITLIDPKHKWALRDRRAAPGSSRLL